MKVSELTERWGLKVLTMPNPDLEVTGCYVGDLLSWVMGRAKEGDAWITIMNNVNILAVASLSAASAVILTEGVLPEKEIIDKATVQGINLFSTVDTSFTTAVKLSKAL